jgi:mono/diheme cytochrome c family protein
MSEGNQPKSGAVNRSLDWGSPQQIIKQLGIALAIIAVWGLLWVIFGASQGAAPTATAKPGQKLTWEEHDFPVVQKHCLLCHGSSGGLSLASYEQTLAGGAHGPAVIPGNAQDSLLYRLISGPAGSIPRMPLGQAPLPPETIALIRDWINQLPPAKQ